MPMTKNQKRREAAANPERMELSRMGVGMRKIRDLEQVMDFPHSQWGPIMAVVRSAVLHAKHRERGTRP